MEHNLNVLQETPSRSMLFCLHCNVGQQAAQQDKTNAGSYCTLLASHAGKLTPQDLVIRETVSHTGLLQNHSEAKISENKHAKEGMGRLVAATLAQQDA